MMYSNLGLSFHETLPLNHAKCYKFTWLKFLHFSVEDFKSLKWLAYLCALGSTLMEKTGIKNWNGFEIPWIRNTHLRYLESTTVSRESLSILFEGPNQLEPDSKWLHYMQSKQNDIKIYKFTLITLLYKYLSNQFLIKIEELVHGLNMKTGVNCKCNAYSKFICLKCTFMYKPLLWQNIYG